MKPLLPFSAAQRTFESAAAGAEPDRNEPQSSAAPTFTDTSSITEAPSTEGAGPATTHDTQQPAAEHREMFAHREKSVKADVGVSLATHDLTGTAREIGPNSSDRRNPAAHQTAQVSRSEPPPGESDGDALRRQYNAQVADQAARDSAAAGDAAAFARNDAERAHRFAQRDAELARQIERNRQDAEIRDQQRNNCFDIAEKLGINTKFNLEAQKLIIRSSMVGPMSEREEKKTIDQLKKMADEQRKVQAFEQASEQRRKAAESRGENTRYWHDAETYVPHMEKFGKERGLTRDEVASIVHEKYRPWHSHSTNAIAFENEIQLRARQKKRMDEKAPQTAGNNGGASAPANSRS